MTYQSDPETVAQTLEAEWEYDHPCPMIEALHGRTDWETLTYEDWTRPVKHVPELAIKAGENDPWLIDYREPDELYHVEPGPDNGARVCVRVM